MPKIKLTKTELKRQRDALKQFTRFLPTLQLKKQQLQLEMRKCDKLLADNREKEEKLRADVDEWVALFGPAETVERLTSIVTLDSIEQDEQNIAGVKVPVFKEAKFTIAPYDLFVEDLWIDDAVAAIRGLVAVRAEREIIEEQRRRIAAELRTTTQRVNLFEKVKIPECKENIRVIQIYLGDMDTAGVCRSKLAKRKIQEAAA